MGLYRANAAEESCPYMMLEREVIRNETLLLLISLVSQGSEDLRKIVAFEGAFER